MNKKSKQKNHAFEPHIRAYLTESTLKRLEKINGQRIRTKLDFHINCALDQITKKGKKN